MDRRRGIRIGTFRAGIERSVGDDGGDRRAIPRYGTRVSRDLTAVTKQRPNDQIETARSSCEPRKQLVSTQIQLSAGSAGFLPPEALPRFAFRINKDYMKKMDLIYELREDSYDVILSTSMFLCRNKVAPFSPRISEAA